MAGRLQNKIALITGSSAGIGRATAELFAAEGATVVVNDDGRRPELGPQVVETIAASGGRAVYCRADVSQSDQVRALIDFALDEFGRLDVLMNNAFSGRSQSTLEMREADWDAVYAVTVKACAIACQAALPAMIEGGGGSIINVSSVHGLLAGRQNAPYNAFKAALVNLSRQMAVDYGVHNVRVNALCPGRIITEAKTVMLNQHPEEERRQQFVYPLGRPGTAREAAQAALFLASDDSSFVTGHALVVDGGLTAQLQDAVSKYVEEGLRAAGALD